MYFLLISIYILSLLNYALFNFKLLSRHNLFESSESCACQLKPYSTYMRLTSKQASLQNNLKLKRSIYVIIYSLITARTASGLFVPHKPTTRCRDNDRKTRKCQAYEKTTHMLGIFYFTIAVLAYRVNQIIYEQKVQILT